MTGTTDFYAADSSKIYKFFPKRVLTNCAGVYSGVYYNSRKGVIL